MPSVSTHNPGSSLGLIPNRMPGTGYDLSGYRYTDIDPLSGAEKHPTLRFDTSGRPYNAAPGSPESFQSITEGMARSALARGAIAPLWEVLTAKAQTDAGDPSAGLTEEERAGRAGQLAALMTATNRGKPATRYKFNSFLCNSTVGYRHISCLKSPRSAANEADWRVAA